MDITTLFANIKRIRQSSHGGFEDFADKFNCIYTVAILSLITSIITLKQYLFTSFSCYLPQTHSGTNLLNYVENIWLEGTVPMREGTKFFSKWDEWKDKKKMTYYKWVPIVLGLQCIGFYFPRVISRWIWRQHVNMDIQQIIQISLKKDGSAVETSKAMKSMIKYKNATYYVVIYLFSKFLYIANVSFQIFFLHKFLDLHWAYGVIVFWDLFHDRDWRKTDTFARVGYCAPLLPTMGVSSNRLTAQCVLPTNFFNEVAFVFLWFWFLLAGVLEILSYFYWLFRLTFFFFFFLKIN